MKRNKKGIIIIIFSLFLIVEVVFFTMKIKNNNEINKEFQSISHNNEMISKEIDKLSNITLEKMFENKNVNDELKNLGTLITKNQQTINDMPNMSKEKNKKRADMQAISKSNKAFVTDFSSVYTVTQVLSNIVPSNPFSGNEFSKKIVLDKMIDKENKEKLTDTITKLKESDKKDALLLVKQNVESQNDAIVAANQDIAKYLDGETILAVPTAHEYSQLLVTIDAVENEDLREELLGRIDSIRVEEEDAIIKEKRIALTFDDGPNNTSTAKILDVLAKQNVEATFFVLGTMVDQYPEMLKKIAGNGHEIGNHSYDHKDLTTLSNEAIAKQINDTNESIEKVTGTKPTLLRPPYGAYNSNVEAVSGMRIMLWNVDSLDWQSKNSEKIFNEITTNVKPGSVILMHDIQSASADTLDKLIVQLKKEGYTFCLASELTI